MEVRTFEAKNRLSALLNEVARGGEVIITRRGKPIARLVPVQSAPDRDKAGRAADAILARSKGVTSGGVDLGKWQQACWSLRALAARVRI